MDRSELLNDQVETMQQILDGRQSQIWTAMPGIIQSVNFSKMTCVVQLTIQGQIEDANGNIQSVNISPLVDVPLLFPSGGGFTVTFPMAVNDEVLVVMASRCIDSWWQSGGYQNLPMETRMHDLSDGFAIPGPKSVPRVIPGINTSKLQIRNNAGTVYFQMGSQFALKNATTDLKTLLSDLNTTLSTFMTVLAGFGGGGAPVTQAMLQAPAAAAVASLILVLAEITALLEAS